MVKTFLEHDGDMGPGWGLMAIIDQVVCDNSRQSKNGRTEDEIDGISI